MVDIQRIQSAFSSVYHLITLHKLIDDSPTLLQTLEKNLPHIEAQSWGSRFDFGGVFVNGLAVYADMPLPEPCKVEYYEPKFPIDEAKYFYAIFSKDWIVWEDSDLVVCFKPAKLPSLPAKEQRNYNLKSYLEDHYSTHLHFPSRLDMSTQGLIIASKTERMHKSLQGLFEHRQIKKEYLFETTGEVTFETLIVDAPIGKSTVHLVLRTPNGKDSKTAKTVFSFIAEGVVTNEESDTIKTAFVKAEPLTGRTHQIRVHAAHSEIAIIGDNFYGGMSNPILHLLSFALTFEHPFTEQLHRIEIPERLWPPWARPALKSLRERNKLL